ncbi:MAG TPA: chemotaxis protein CheW [Gammaproteobacteria bacterium]
MTASSSLQEYLDTLLAPAEGPPPQAPAAEPARTPAAEPPRVEAAPRLSEGHGMDAHALYKTMLEARALLDSSGDARRGSASACRCIAFRAGEEVYAVDLGAVREVIVPPEIVPVPGAGREVLGVINLRGNVLTVINSRVTLGLTGRPDSPSARILVLDEGDGCVGAMVDAVEDILLVDPEQLEPVLAAGPRETQRQVRGTVTVGDRIVFVIAGATLVGGAPTAS